MGVWSVSVARGRGRSLSHTFVVCDWLLLGLALAFGGFPSARCSLQYRCSSSSSSCPANRAEWPYLVGPSLLVPIVLAIADPTLAGHRALVLGALAGLVLAGLAAAMLLRRAPRRSRVAAAPAVDATSGFYSRTRLKALVPAELVAAEASHEPLAARLRAPRPLPRPARLPRAGRQRGRRAHEARRLKRVLGPDDLAFRLSPDLFAFTLRGHDARAARDWAREAGHEVTGRLIDRHRQTLSFGCAAYPPVHDPRELLDDALAALSRLAAPELVVAPAATAGALARRGPLAAAAPPSLRRRRSPPGTRRTVRA